MSFGMLVMNVDSKRHHDGFDSPHMVMALDLNHHTSLNGHQIARKKIQRTASLQWCSCSARGAGYKWITGKKTTQRVHDELRRAQNRKNRNGGTEMAGRRCRGVVEDLRKQVPNHHRCLSIPVGGVVHQLERRAGDQ